MDASAARITVAAALELPALRRGLPEVVAGADASLNSGAKDGFVGCGTAADLKTAYGIDAVGAAKGDRFGPLAVTSADGSPAYAFVEIASVDGPTYVQVAAQLEAAITADASGQQSNAAGLLLQLAYHDADVSIDPRFGTWDDVLLQVTPAATAGR